jgi:hypothetical protein
MTQHVAKYVDQRGKPRTVKFDLEPLDHDLAVPTTYLVHCAGIQDFEVVFPSHLQTARAHIATVMEAMDW